ncbi:hypothetical protein HYALB_00011728 [Hymenoscyphus albidus]|uniref:Rhodopsin domain-containing protein n=1 Tax=Hymenoscyphus albidus TaxID=595503 RepID=A0A9N9Q747_9HELO|nr:hypothetical protein HYALB_00011728 [Hymenoscyphus albidus]
MNATSDPLAKNPETQGILWVQVTIPITVFTIFLVWLRVWWRRRMSGAVAPTDISVLVSLLCAIIQEVLGCIAIFKWGLGHHTAYIGRHKASQAMMYFYVYQIFYKILVSTTKVSEYPNLIKVRLKTDSETKMSFVFLYLDLFPISTFRRVCYVVQTSVIVAMISFVAGTIFQCTPIPYFWNRTISGGHCVNTAAFWYGHAAWNTAGDVVILLLPLPVIRSLRMGRGQKLAVSGIFGLGAFVIVASIMRMIALNPASKVAQADMTYVISTSSAFLWTQVESCVAIICVCLPTLKGLIKIVMPTLFTTGIRSAHDGYELDQFHWESSETWKDKRKKSHGGKVANIFDERDSEEIIMGIARTVDVEVTKDYSTETTTAGNEIFRGSNGYNGA